MAVESVPAPPAPAAAPAAPPGATDGGPGTEIHVTPATVDKGPKLTPPRKGSAMDQVFEDLRKKVKPESAPDPTPEPSTPAAAVPSADGKPPQAAGDTPAPAAPAAEEKKSKNPWKLVDEYKARAVKAETDLVEARNSGLNPEERKSLDKQLSDLRTQNEELEKEIRFVNYAKSNEFKTKYQQPYEKEWERAAKEVSEIRITDPESGQQRAATVNDLYQVVVAPLNEARDIADNLFGKFADDVMSYRKSIRSLNDAQEGALKSAHDASIARDKAALEQRQNFLNQTAGEIKKTWDQANHEFGERADLAFIFKPADTDAEHKTRLDKGYALVDKAFATKSADPKLTAEQRAEAVKMHAAVRMRAAAFGPMRYLLQQRDAKIAALEKEVAEFRQTVPPTGGTSGPDNTPPKASSGWDSVRAGLQRIAKPQ